MITPAKTNNNEGTTTNILHSGGSTEAIILNNILTINQPTILPKMIPGIIDNMPQIKSDFALSSSVKLTSPLTQY